MLTSNLTIAILLVVAAVCQIMGTISVAVNYYRTGAIAQIIIDRSKAQLASVHWERDKLAAIAGELTRTWWLTLGLIAYIVGAISGLAAGLIWLYR
ncbi:MAG TPA: hypothetical protein VIH90_02635 [Candidatus Saccharimonadales bacterium]